MKTKEFKKFVRRLNKDDFNDIDVLDFLIKGLKLRKKELKNKEDKMLLLAEQVANSIRMFGHGQVPGSINSMPRFSPMQPYSGMMNTNQATNPMGEDCTKCVNKDVCPDSTAKSTGAMDKHKH